MAGSGHTTKKGWNVPSEGPEINPEDYRSEKTKSNSRSELSRDCFHDNHHEQDYDNIGISTVSNEIFQFEKSSQCYNST